MGGKDFDMRRVGIVLCAALMVVFVGPVSVAEPAAAAPGSSTRWCGRAPYLKPDGSAYVCSFMDDFSGTSLNPDNWVVETSDGWSGFSPERTCYVDTPEHIFVRDGALNLVGRISDLPAPCRTRFKGTFFTKFSGGAVVSWEKFSQAYGLFSFRARFPDTQIPGYYGNLWMSPQKLTYGGWPRSGEIDVAEYWTGDPDTVHPSVHYQGHTRADTAWDCKVPNVGEFHTYTVQWNTDVMNFYYDSELCFSRSWRPWNGTDGRPFNQPFVLVMSQGLGDPYFSVKPNSEKSGAMQVDWVKVWR